MTSFCQESKQSLKPSFAKCRKTEGFGLQGRVDGDFEVFTMMSPKAPGKDGLASFLASGCGRAGLSCCELGPVPRSSRAAGENRAKMCAESFRSFF